MNNSSAINRLRSVVEGYFPVDRLYPDELYEIAQSEDVTERFRAGIDQHLFYGAGLPDVHEEVVFVADDPEHKARKLREIDEEISAVKSEIEELECQLSDLRRKKEELII